MLVVGGLLVTSAAMAEEAAGGSSGTGWMNGIGALAPGLTMGLAVIGGALGQSRTIASALEGIARNPAAADKIGTPMIIGLALMESLVLFAFAIAFLKYPV